MIVSETVTESTILPDIQAIIAVLGAYRKDLYKSGNSTRTSVSLEGTGTNGEDEIKVSFVMVESDDAGEFIKQYTAGDIKKEDILKVLESEETDRLQSDST